MMCIEDFVRPLLSLAFSTLFTLFLAKTVFNLLSLVHTSTVFAYNLIITNGKKTGETATWNCVIDSKNRCVDMAKKMGSIVSNSLILNTGELNYKCEQSNFQLLYQPSPLSPHTYIWICTNADKSGPAKNQWNIALIIESIN